MPADVSKREEVYAAVDKAVAELGSLDVRCKPSIIRTRQVMLTLESFLNRFWLPTPPSSGSNPWSIWNPPIG